MTTKDTMTQIEADSKKFFADLDVSMQEYRAENIKRERRFSIMLDNPCATMSELNKLFKKEKVNKMEIDKKEFFDAIAFAACIALPFVIYFAFVMKP